MPKVCKNTRNNHHCFGRDHFYLPSWSTVIVIVFWKYPRYPIIRFPETLPLGFFSGLPNEPLFFGGTPKALKETFKAARLIGTHKRNTINHVILCSESSGIFARQSWDNLPTDGRWKKIGVSDFKASRQVRDFFFTQKMLIISCEK